VTDVHPVAAAGFGAAADVYERARPSYPDDAVAWLVEQAAIGPPSTVVDVGAGTGKLTRLLVATGARVLAVEPLGEMRNRLRELVPRAEALDGTAEALPLGDSSVDAITVAQAFHWFDPTRALPELHRVLRPGGALVLIWNSRDLDDPLQRGLEDLLTPYRNELIAQSYGVWRPPLDESPLFAPLREARFPYAQQLTADGLVERAESTSFVAALPEDERLVLLGRVRALADGLDEPFDFNYVTEVYLARRIETREPSSSSAD
jgi:SAM-dependent methyltransferase